MALPGSRDQQGNSTQSRLTENPYSSPRLSEAEPWPRDLSRRFPFLTLPPLIPLAIHGVVRIFLPRDEVTYHAMFLLGAIIVAWVWSASMLERLPLRYWSRYLLSSVVWGAVLISAFFATNLVDCLGR